MRVASVLLWLGILCRIMTLFVTVETGEMVQVLASRTGYVRGMDTDDWGGVFPGSLEILCRRSRHSRTTKNVGARSVGARNMGACLESPGLTPGTWPWWCGLGNYLGENANPSL